MSEFTDQTIHCSDCRRDFVWTAGEQEYWKKKGLQHPPKRCKPCRDVRRQSRPKQDQQTG